MQNQLKGPWLIKFSQPAADRFKLPDLEQLSTAGSLADVRRSRHSRLVEARAFVRLWRASDFLLRGQDKVTKKKATLLGACRAAPDKSVSRGRAFRQHIHVLAKRSRHPCRLPCGPVVHDSPPHKGLKIKSNSNSNSNSNSHGLVFEDVAYRLVLWRAQARCL